MLVVLGAKRGEVFVRPRGASEVTLEVTLGGTGESNLKTDSTEPVRELQTRNPHQHRAAFPSDLLRCRAIRYMVQHLGRD